MAPDAEMSGEIAEAHDERGAVLSADGMYRYRLDRGWSTEGGNVCWVMLNPSTADAFLDDPTIRRCIGFSKAWGYGGLTVVNLFAYRATDPADLYAAHRSNVHVIGPDNEEHLQDAVSGADLTVAAWGTNGVILGREGIAVNRLVHVYGYTLHCVGKTKHGHPKHPLYVKGDTAPLLYKAPQVGSSPKEGR